VLARFIDTSGGGERSLAPLGRTRLPGVFMVNPSPSEHLGGMFGERKRKMKIKIRKRIKSKSKRKIRTRSITSFLSSAGQRAMG
jgi:hypothetical protein